MQFPNPTMMEGARLTLENARTLIEDAELLATIGRYGRGSSLLVLASEETVKAMVAHYMAVAPVPESMHWQQAFFSHKAKQGVLSVATRLDTLFDSLMPLLEAAVANLDTMRSPDGTLSDAMMRTYLERQMANPEFRAEFERRMELAEKSALWWFQEADTMKQRGFYVHYDEPDRWESPQMIPEEQYVALRERTVTRFQRVQRWVGNDRAFDRDAEVTPEAILQFIASTMALSVLAWKWGNAGPKKG